MKSLITISIIFISLNTFSQGYLSTSIINKGVEFNLGFLSDKVDFNYGVQFPLMNITVPTIHHISVGRMFALGNDYSFTTSIGGAVSKNRYNKEKNTAAYYSLEVGKDANLGRLFIKSMYCNQFYYAIGMRAFINR